MSKAGSSAIQKVLLDNEEVLRQHGLIYPIAGRYAGAHYTINEQLLSGQYPELLLDALREAKDLTPIISCEGFWLLGDKEIEQIKDALSGYAVKVILYLRNPCGYMPSSYRQSIKTMDAMRKQADYIAYAFDRMDYSLVLKRWASNFQLNVKVYDQVRGALLEDFLQVLGVAPNVYKIPVELTNPTLPDGTFEAMRLLNRFFKGKLARRTRSWISRHPKLFSKLGLDDRQIREHARSTPLTWDLAVMNQFLAKEELECLVKGTVLESSLVRPEYRNMKTKNFNGV